MVPSTAGRASPAARSIAILLATVASGCGLLLPQGDDAVRRDAGRDAGAADGSAPSDAEADGSRTDASAGDGASADGAEGDALAGDAGIDAASGPACLDGFGDIVACNAMTGSCAWYSCSGQCLPNVPGLGVSCGCGHIGTDRALCEVDTACEWDAMSGRCQPRSMTMIDVCTRYPEASSCDIALGCRWMECVRTCYPADVEPSTVCGCWRYTDAAACEGDANCNWACGTACVPHTVDLVALCGA